MSEWWLDRQLERDNERNDVIGSDSLFKADMKTINTLRSTIGSL